MVGKMTFLKSCAIIAFLVAGCNSGGAAANTLTITTQQGLVDASVIWSITEPEGGTIDQNGFYVVPKTPGQYHINITH